MNSQVIKLAENGHEFFLQYPKALDKLNITIEGKTIADFFNLVHETLSKEKSEHVSAGIHQKEVKHSVRELKKSLRDTAYALERGINSVLDLENREDEEVDFVSGTDLVLRFEEFSAQLTKFQTIIDQNPSYKRAFDKFKTELAEYKAASSEIGDSKIATDTEKEELIDAIEQYEAIIAGLHSLIRRYLSKTNSDLYEIYIKRLRRKTTTKDNSDSEAQSDT